MQLRMSFFLPILYLLKLYQFLSPALFLPELFRIFPIPFVFLITFIPLIDSNKCDDTLPFLHSRQHCTNLAQLMNYS